MLIENVAMTQHLPMVVIQVEFLVKPVMSEAVLVEILTQLSIFARFVVFMR